MKRFLRSVPIRAALAVLASAAFSLPAAAADAPSFAGKTVNMTIGFEAGGGVDLFGRILGQNLVRHLPGEPNLVVLNQTGAGGVGPMSSWVQKADPDGLAVTIGAQSQIDPEALMRTHAAYDPMKLKYVGGVAAPSQALFARKDAVARLTDKSQKPVVMGIVGTTLRTGYYQTLWGVAFLGWNVKWAPGYRATGELRQAMERGEVDMSSFGSIRDIKYLLDSGEFTVVSQSGMMEGGKQVARPILGKAPIMYDLLKGKIKDPAALEALDYAEFVSQIGRWLALPPGTPESIVATYVKAFEETLKDPQYKNAITKTDPDSPIARKADLEALVRGLAKASPKTLEFIQAEMKRQGL